MLAFLPALERFRDEGVGEHELRLGHLRDRQMHDLLLRIAHADRGLVALDADDFAAKAFAAFDHHGHFDLRFVSHMALEVGTARQRAVDAGRGQFQPIAAADRIVDVERGRKRAARRLAILDREGAVGALRHDLNRAAVAARDMHAHEPIAQIREHRLRDRGNPRRQSGFGDEPRLIHRGFRMQVRVVHRFSLIPPEPNKKERVPVGAHSHHSVLRPC